MKKNFTILLSLVFLVVSLQSCSKSNDTICDIGQPMVSMEQKKMLEAYIDSTQVKAIYHEAGFYFHIDAEGAQRSPDGCSKVLVNYSGQLTNGREFDRANNVEFNLNNLISGWRMGLPLIKEGGIITLYLPAEMGYGSSGIDNVIPKNAITIFKIELLKIQ